MNSEIFLMIDSYIDGELSPQDEDILFEQLALESDARDYFRKVNLIKNGADSLADEFPSKLERDIIGSINRRSSGKFSNHAGITGYVAAGISVILLIISLLLLNQVSGYRNEINSVINQINKQNIIIEALYNSFPPTEVHPEYSDEIIIKPKI